MVSNSRPGPSSQKRKKHVKPAVKTLVDLRDAAKMSDLPRNSYPSDESDSDGTPPPSILLALARAGVKLKGKDKEGTRKGKEKNNFIQSKRCTDIIELSDSDSFISLHRPKKRAKTSIQDKQGDVIDLCSDEDKQSRGGRPSISTKDNILVPSSDDEQATVPHESSPILFSSPEKGKTKTKSDQLRYMSTSLSPHTVLPRRSAYSLDVGGKDPMEEVPPSRTLLKGSERVGKRKRLTQQDFIAALNSGQTTSFSFSSSFLTSRSNSRVHAHKKYNIKYSDEHLNPPLLTQTLFSRTIATMKVCPLQNQSSYMQTNFPAINLSAMSSNNKPQRSEDQASSSQVIAEELSVFPQTDVRNTRSKSGFQPPEDDILNIASELEPQENTYYALPQPPPYDSTCLSAPCLNHVMVQDAKQETFVESRMASSVNLYRQGTQLPRSLSVLRIDAAELTASIILESFGEDGDSDDDFSLSGLELAYPEPES